MSSKERTDFERVYEIVRQIPSGKVATYGAVARWLGWPHGARTVGWALRALKAGQDVPWHRVINSRGRISLSNDVEQRVRLESEGVVFNERGAVDLKTYAWSGPTVPDKEFL